MTKLHYRLPPCPSYDIEGTQSWLESLAEKGLFLSEEGISDSLLRFDAAEGKRVRYRMDAAPADTGLLSPGAEPEQEAVEIAAASGWKYLRKYGQFHLYLCADDTAPELNTDPAVQAMALQLVRKRERSSAFQPLFWMIFYLVFYGFSCPLLMTITAGLPLVTLGLLFCLSLTAGSVHRLIVLRRLHKRLTAGESLGRKDWGKTAARYRIGRGAGLLVSILFLIGLMCYIGDDLSDTREIPLADYTGTIPCATMADMGTDFVLDETGYRGSAITVYSSPLAPTALSLRQYGSVTLSDGRRISGVFYIDYYEAASDRLADELVKEQLRADRKGWKYTCTPLDLPDLPVEYAFAYTTDLEVFPIVLLQNGNRVLHVQFFQWGDYEHLSVSEWASFFAESIR
jgi:hypothetical protein